MPRPAKAKKGENKVEQAVKRIEEIDLKLASNGEERRKLVGEKRDLEKFVQDHQEAQRREALGAVVDRLSPADADALIARLSGCSADELKALLPA